MTGTIEGGLKAAATNKHRYGKSFYKTIGAAGGKKSTKTGFGSDKVGKDGLTGRARAAIAGAEGGRKSKRS